jgi:proteasomal ATPase-associated factor 1
MSMGRGDLEKDRKSAILHIQPDWDVAFKGKDDSIWVSFKSRGTTSRHGTISREKRTSLDWHGDENFRVIRWRPDGPLLVEHKDSGLKTEFLAPNRIFKGIHLKAVNCVDVSGGGLGVSACTGGEVKIWDTDRGIARRTFEGHVDEATVCKFFPSGVVVITGGVDMRLKIWSAETGDNPVTMTGHAGAITDVAIIDKGRNVLSTSRDGRARLWDVGESSCLHEYDVGKGVINSCDLQQLEGLCTETSEERSDREVGTEGKVLAVGCEAGRVSLIDVRSREVVKFVDVGDAVNVVRWAGSVDGSLLAVGCENGRMVFLDTRKFDASSPTAVIHDSLSPIVSAAAISSPRVFNGSPGLALGRRDGTTAVYSVASLRRSSFSGDEADVPLQLTGSDCDPIYGMATANGGEAVFTASRDSFIRRYNLLAA